MLVTFKSNAHGDITMFDTAAIPLLKMAGLSGNVPGALMAEDVGPALQTLTAALQEPEEAGGADPSSGVDEESPVPLAARALPLIELMQAARDASENVLWES